LVFLPEYLLQLPHFVILLFDDCLLVLDMMAVSAETTLLGLDVGVFFGDFVLGYVEVLMEDLDVDFETA
jgi:hypothetical protein